MPYRMNSGQWRAHKMIDGRRKTKVFDRKADAAKWEAGQSAATWTQAETPAVTVCEWGNRYLDFVKETMVPQVYAEKQRALQELTAVVGRAAPVENITPIIALRVIDARANASSGYAANKLRKNLAAAWEWGRRFLALQEANPFRAVPKRPEERHPRYVPPVEDMERVLATETGEVRVLLLTMLHTAARRGELLRLTWSDVDIAGRKITLSTRKTKDSNLERTTLPMTEELTATLAEHKKSARGVFVFCDEDGQPYKYRQHLMKRVCKRAGVKLFGFHAIRHLSTSMLDRAGLDLSTIQAILRHKSATTTARYLHSLRGVRAAVDEVFGGKVIEMKKASSGSNGTGQ